MVPTVEWADEEPAPRGERRRGLPERRVRELEVALERRAGLGDRRIVAPRRSDREERWAWLAVVRRWWRAQFALSPEDEAGFRAEFPAASFPDLYTFDGAIRR